MNNLDLVKKYYTKGGRKKRREDSTWSISTDRTLVNRVQDDFDGLVEEDRIKKVEDGVTLKGT